MVMRFPAKKNAVAQKPCTISRQEKMAFSTPRSGCLGTPLPLPQSLYGRTDGRMDGHTLTSQPKFFGSMGYQICLAMKLRWRALPAGSGIIIIIIIIILKKNIIIIIIIKFIFPGIY